MDAPGAPMDPAAVWIIVILVLATYGLVIWSIVRILHRMGLSGWWVLTMGFWPIMLPILAYCRWPALDEQKAEIFS